MVRTVSSKDSVLPENPKWFSIDVSDADARRWPTNTTPNPDKDGFVNYMQPLAIDHGQSIKWRLIIGQSLAEMLKYPDHESKSWVLKAWPPGYQFYDHNKGLLSGSVRHDLYLVGSELVARFRSPAEFIPHAYWLITDPTRNRNNCNCKYCAKRPQREITEEHGLASQRFGSAPGLSQARIPTDIPRPKLDRERATRKRVKPVRDAPKVFTSVRRAPKPVVRLSEGPKQFVVPEREKDLRASLGEKKLGSRRLVREGELVWVKLDYPIPLTDERGNPEEEIVFWPGLIEDVYFRTEIFPKKVQDVEMRDTTNDNITAGNEEDDVPWTIVHKWMYKIKLLVVVKTVLYGEDHILPYQSYAPCNRLLQAIQSVWIDVDAPPELDPTEIILPTQSTESKDEAEARTFKRFEEFDPCPSSEYNGMAKKRFDQASGPFAVAIQIASRLALYWTPTDAWEFQMSVPAELGKPTAPQQAPMMSRRRGGLPKDGTQIRFQGLWWGAERIWMGELVRLKLARFQLAPEGADMIKRPSGAGKSARKERGSTVIRDVKTKAHSDTPPKPNISPASGPSQNLAPPETMTTEANLDLDMGSVANTTQDIQTNGAPHESPTTVNGAINGEQPLKVEEDIDTDMKDDHPEDEDGDGDEDGDDDDLDSLGAPSRGVFMRVDGFFVEQVPNQDGQGVRNECRMCGMLYEIADEDWESGDEAEVEQTALKDPTPTPTSAMAPRATIATPFTNLTVPPNRASSLADVINAASHAAAAASAPAQSLPSVLASNLPLDKTKPVDNAPVAFSGLTDMQVDETLNFWGSGMTGIETPPTPAALSEKARGKQRAFDPPAPTSAPSNALASKDPATPLSANPPSLSSPPSTSLTYPLPTPPSRYKFRAILPPTHEAVVSITLLSGRYYPAILSNPLMRPYVEAALRDPTARENDPYWALEGLVAGVHNAVDATRWRPSRTKMVKEAIEVARKELLDYWRGRVAETNIALQNVIDVDAD